MIENFTMTEDFDIVVVGCGISGSFCAQRLSQFYPDKSILVIERSDRVGGKLQSKNICSDIKAEFGGMRFFPDIHIYVQKLCDDLNLKTVNVEYNNDNNIGYFRGTRYKLGQIQNQTSYKLLKSEQNQNPITFVDNIIMQTMNNLHIKETQLLATPALSKMNFWEYLKIYLSNEMIDFYEDVYGYDFSINDIHTGLGMKENVALNTQPNQLFIADGMQSLVTTLISKFGPNVILRTSCALKSFDMINNGVKLCLIKNNKEFIVNTKKIIITAQQNDLFTLNQWNKQTIDNFNLIIPWTGLKIFLVFKKNWWSALGYNGGRSLTDLPIRQVWYYSSNVLMIYCDTKYPHFWLNNLKTKSSENIIYDQSWVDINLVSDQLINELISQISEMHGVQLIKSSISYVAWHYWDKGTFWWKPCDVIKAKSQLVNPMSNVYLTNCCWSVWQGWVDGAVQNADDLMRDYFNIPSILD